jgi:hypothetical protein
MNDELELAVFLSTTLSMATGLFFALWDAALNLAEMNLHLLG